MSEAPLIGIDLGTTHTLVSVLTPDGPQVLAPPGGDALIPSAVAIDEDGVTLVGAVAAARLQRDPASGARWFKRDMGSSQPYTLAGRSLTPTELSAIVLSEARRVAEQVLAQPVRKVVVTVPAYFQEPQRAATREAGELAGLDVVRMINEPTAAAIAYGVRDTETERRVAVLDLGGGTFDVTVLEIFDGIIEVVACGGDARLGGEDFTDALLAQACSAAGLKAPQPGEGLDWRRALLRERCEAAKRALSHRPEATVPLPDPRAPVWRPVGSMSVTGATLEAAAAGLLERLRRCVQDTLRTADLGPDGVDEVLLVGGASRMGCVQRLAEQLLGRTPRLEDPDHAIALGAAIQAGLIGDSAAVEDIVVTDVLSHSLGIEIVRQGKDRILDGYFLPVLHRNTTLPLRRVERVQTLHHEQDEVRVRIFQGEHRYVSQNRLLGEITLGDIPAVDEGRVQAVDIAFTHDLNGLLEVEARLVSTGELISLLIEEQAGRLSPEARERALQAMARLKIHPRELLPNKLLLEEALSLHARLTPGQQKRLDPLLLQFEDALTRQHPEDITATAQQLRTALRWLRGEG